MTGVITECPACEAPVEIELTEVSRGDCVVCSECDEALTVVSVKPLELAVEDDDDEEEDDDLNDEEEDDSEDDDEEHYSEDDEDDE